MLASLFLFSGFALRAAASLSNNVQQNVSTVPYSLPIGSNDSAQRSGNITIKRSTFSYGPPLIANMSYWPTGSLGNATVQLHMAQLYEDALPVATNVAADKAKALAAVNASGGLNQLSDYTNLFKGQWLTSEPEGLNSGMLSNYTQDLLFSMERLSLNPYSLKRLIPGTDSLPFKVTAASAITGFSLDTLFSSGRLFYIDHRDQSTLERVAGRYAAACDAYFYIHPKTGDFLPLAIRTDGAALVYTPLDSKNEWLLAKMMFNLNDSWHSQWYHFSATHFINQIVYQSAFRSLSELHPIMALLDRITPKLYAFGVNAITTLFARGAAVDRTFSFTGASAPDFSSKLWTDSASKFQANYFKKNLATRGLIDSRIGPPLKSFPFYEDALPIHTAMEKFWTSFVDSYYTDSTVFEQDKELKAWFSEAIPADIKDFPTQVNRRTLVDILTHFTFLNTVVHHTLNTNSLEDQLTALPIHPWSLSLPPPTAKGKIVDLVPFLPNATTSINQIALAGSFARNSFSYSQWDMTNMFANTTLLTRLNIKTTRAAETFRTEMLAHSKKVSSKKFNVQGLSQGMPFIWRSLDPQRAPYYFAV